MKRFSIALAGAVLSVCTGAGAADFEGAKWIWYSREPMPMTHNFPGAANYFRSTFVLSAAPAGAELLVTADNLYTVFLNGKPAGEGSANANDWNKPRRFDVTAMLAAGTNTVAIEAINTIPGAAGLIAKLVAKTADGREAVLVTDEPWKSGDAEVAKWNQPGFDDSKWRAAHVVGEYGIGPWGRIAVPAAPVRAGGEPDDARKQVIAAIAEQKEAARREPPATRQIVETEAPADFAWPEAVVFVGDDCSLYRPKSQAASSMDSLSVTIFNPRDSRAFPEHDLPAPMKVGRKLCVLKPAKPGVSPRVLLDAGQGAVGSPSVSFDGKTILVSMAKEGDAFFHIFKIPAGGGAATQLTSGPFFDIDPAELPDGRIVFTSTRIGTFEEYHNPPSRSLFVMHADGSNIKPLTHTFIFDNEPEVLADGRILFIRSDNFFDRGKVETILHAIHPDGTEGYTEFALEMGPEYGGRLRAYNCGSPAPMPDGRVAFVTGSDIVLGRPGTAARDQQRIRVPAGDVAAMGDGRLLCTLPSTTAVEVGSGKKKKVVNEVNYEKIAVVDPRGKDDRVVTLFKSPGEPLHSPVHLGARPRPAPLAQRLDPLKEADPKATGILFCQDARFTKNTTAGWPHIRAIRVLAGQGLTMRSSHSYIVHAGSDVTELGTVPLAEDGSFAVEVPADTAIAFQAVDGEGRSELNEMSWIYVRPGEKRGCIGCHQPRQNSPPCASARILAMQTPPLKLTGGSRPLRFRGNNAAVTGLMELQADRFREIAGINRHAETRDAVATGAREVSELVGWLKGGDESLAVSAAQRLAIFRDRAAAPELAGALRAESRELRVAAAFALSACGTRESVPPLLAALGDAEPLVAQSAAVALENLTGHYVPFNAFAAAENSGQQAIETWRSWIAKTSWGEIERGLVGRLASTNRDEVRRAAVALGHIGGDVARAALRDYVARERSNNPYPEWRKTHQGDGARFNSLSVANPRTLQEATRALGWLRDGQALPMLAETLRKHADPHAGNLFLAEAAAEALGRIGTPDALRELGGALAGLGDYPNFSGWYGDHSALIACHASPVHYLIAEALDAGGAKDLGASLPALIRSVPTDFDRALLPANDDAETLAGRIIRRAGAETRVVETCLSVLGDTTAVRDAEIETALSQVHGAWGGKPTTEIRAAQILSLACRDTRFEPRVRAAFERHRALTNDIPRVFDTGIPVVQKLPLKHWASFFLARTLGHLADRNSFDALLAALDTTATEAANGRPDPLGPGNLFLHDDLTPCWRAEVAWALGRIGDQRAAPVLAKVIADFENAPDTRHAAAGALAHLGARTACAELAAACPDIATRKILSRGAAPP